MISASSWQLNGKVISIVVVIAFQSFNKDIGDREPNGTSPIGIAAEHATIAFAGHISNDFVFPLYVKRKRVRFVVAGERANSERRKKLILVQEIGE